MNTPLPKGRADAKPRNALDAGHPLAPRLSLALYPDKVLRTICEPVDVFDSALRDLTEEMFSLMQYHQSIGLAAPQVGVRRRLIVCSLGDCFLALTNFEVKDAAEPRDFSEGCLSLPGVHVNMRRPERIKVTGYDVRGQRRAFAAVGLWARVIQHELDHPNGVLICDYAPPEAGKGVRCSLELAAELVGKQRHRSRPKRRRREQTHINSSL